MDSRIAAKYSSVAQMVVGLHDCVPCMRVGQHMAHFKETKYLSVCPSVGISNDDGSDIPLARINDNLSATIFDTDV